MKLTQQESSKGVAQINRNRRQKFGNGLGDLWVDLAGLGQSTRVNLTYLTIYSQFSRLTCLIFTEMPLFFFFLCERNY